ncbi:hypothetical protein PC116_g7523 [Phytophthora cactorum]|uniref:Uncharacterized protein n=1 Tax=Phytophthora cactorum TaxID=29920 RepID=A0A8T1DQ69_9STRA|nr:hypothetical protein Pcac1_g17484 [Phytophthora cactorum]KAG2921436.1 hypothetical protein PC114_g5691 [Phytophthora cactorum]KAG2942660.1 hypothetical protein PC117_g9714 [Phytophthora cactorum]KAG3004663.1 hypothetical protein PC120_g18425 [Phytophthora cactorum]KAG3021541.1 hypothetical protein PC119_g9604 [Phytophthora cactorum]
MPLLPWKKTVTRAMCLNDRVEHNQANIFPTDKNDRPRMGYARPKVEVPRISSIDEVTAASTPRVTKVSKTVDVDIPASKSK